MTTIGNDALPGVTTRQESNSSVVTNVSAPNDVGIIGQADLTNGTATANKLYRVTTEPQARRLFGVSELADAVTRSLQNGAYPVYAVAPEVKSVTDDLTSQATVSGSLSQAPVSEVSTDALFTIDSEAKTTILTREDLSGISPASGEVYVNQATGAFKLDGIPSSDGDVSFKYLDYSAALIAMENEAGGEIDWLGVLTENEDVRDSLETQVNRMAQVYKPVIGVVGTLKVADTSAFTNPFDNSRMQVLYYPRDASGESMIGGYLGVRAEIGVRQSGMRKRISGFETLGDPLTEAEKVDMDESKVVVFEYGTSGIRTMNDPTCVSDSNSDEQAYNHGLARLLGDYITLRVEARADPYIGLLHNPGARAALRAEVRQDMLALLDLNAVEAFSVDVEEIDSVRARLTVGVQMAKPLRNIEFVLVGGDVAA